MGLIVIANKPGVSWWRNKSILSYWLIESTKITIIQVSELTSINEKHSQSKNSEIQNNKNYSGYRLNEDTK